MTGFVGLGDGSEDNNSGSGDVSFSSLNEASEPQRIYINMYASLENMYLSV